MTRKVLLISSILGMIAVVVAIVFTSLAWFEVIPTAPAGLSVTSKGYVTLTYTTAPAYRNESGAFVNAQLINTASGYYYDLPNANDLLQLKPAVVEVDSIRDGFSGYGADVLTTGYGITEAATMASFRSNIQYINHVSDGRTDVALRFAAEAYAMVPNGHGGEDRVKLSMQNDILMISDVTMTYYDETSVTLTDNVYLPSGLDHPADYFEFPIDNKDGDLVIESRCYLRQVDELVSSSIRNASKIYIELTVLAVEYTTTLYFYDADGWDDVYAYSWGYTRSATVGNTTQYLITGIEGDYDLGIPMRADPEVEDGDGYLFNGLDVTVAADIGLYYRGNITDYTSTGYTSTVTNGKVHLAPGVYNLYYTPSTKKLKITGNAQYPYKPSEYLGAWGSTQINPLVGHKGWYSVKIPNDAERIIWAGEGTRASAPQSASLRIDYSKPFYYDGTWYATMPSIWDGTITVNISNVSWFGNDGCLPYLYVWYEDGSENAAYPGQAMTPTGGGNYSLMTDTTKTILGMKVARGNVAGVRMFNRTGDLTVPANHTVTLNASDLSDCFVATFTVDVSLIEDFEDDDCVPYLYAWHKVNDVVTYQNAAWPGVEMVKTGQVYTCTIDCTYLSGIIIARSDGTDVFGQTRDITDYGTYTFIFSQWDSESTQN